MSEGVAEYRKKGVAPLRILILENALKKMDPSFEGCPVFVHHNPDFDYENVESEADGYVVESFFNQLDGKHWSKFIVISDEGFDAVKRKWKLSNAYSGTSFSNGGQWHGVDYSKEITQGRYEHLALVPNPRYEESMILTPEEFKEYNAGKEAELLRLANSKDSIEEQGDNSMFWKKGKADNIDETMMVTLPKSKKDKSLVQIINDMDAYEMAQLGPQMANNDHHVMVGDKQMRVGDLLDCYNASQAEMAEMKKLKDGVENDDSEDKKKKEAAEKLENSKKAEETLRLENEKKAEDAKAAETLRLENEKKELEAKKAKEGDKEHFDKLMNAKEGHVTVAPFGELLSDKVARGKARYGAN